SEIRQIARSRPYRQLVQTSESIGEALVSSGIVHAEELGRIANRVRGCASVISLTGDVTRDMAMLDLLFDLQCGDAFIYASVYRYFKQRPVVQEQRLFVTRDKDFEKTEEYLAAIGCELVLGFGAAIGLMKVS